MSYFCLNGRTWSAKNSLVFGFCGHPTPRGDTHAAAIGRAGLAAATQARTLACGGRVSALGFLPLQWASIHFHTYDVGMGEGATVFYLLSQLPLVAASAKALALLWKVLREPGTRGGMQIQIHVARRIVRASVCGASASVHAVAELRVCFVRETFEGDAEVDGMTSGATRKGITRGLWAGRVRHRLVDGTRSVQRHPQELASN